MEFQDARHAAVRAQREEAMDREAGLRASLMLAQQQIAELRQRVAELEERPRRRRRRASGGSSAGATKAAS